MSANDRQSLMNRYERWKAYNHKVSASKQWKAYRDHVCDYPSAVTYNYKVWTIYDMSCGKRNNPDELFLIREISVEEYLFDEEGKRREHGWYSSYVVNPTTNLFYEICESAVHWVARSDESLKEWMSKYTNKLQTPQLYDQEKENSMCRCRTSHCYCDSALTYEINEHSLTVDVSKGKTIRLTLEECAELSSFLATAKGKIKEAKLAALKEQQDLLATQLKEVEAL